MVGVTARFLLLAAVTCVAATTNADPVGQSTAKIPPAAFENPKALDGFVSALKAQRAKTAARPLRISYFGDSLTANDQITNALRTKLAALLGDGGPGFAWAVEPHPYNQHRALSRWVTGSWRVNGISTRPAPDQLLGFGGSAETDGGGTIRFAPASPVSSIDVHYLAQPRGGTLSILADGKPVASIPTSGEKKKGEFARAEIPDGTKKIELRASGRVRLFGASLEAATGSVVDNLGVNSATAKQMSRYNLADHLRNQLAHRAPDLVVVMLGTNEAEWLAPNGSGMAEHEKLYGELLASVRAANPNGSCLVVSPLDQTDWRAENMPPRASIPAMVDAQRRAASANNCAFWDVYTWMGGKGASKQWLRRGLLMKDFQHPTTPGAQRIAAALYAGLVQ
jgi:lysophospholipase L1-like esterase